MAKNAILSEISKWSIEAKEEDNEQYFFYFDEVEQLENGTKNYVIGRKGTGKTAIAEYLHGHRSYGRFSKLLSFKNFPFNSLYGFADADYNRPNQYITIWTYVIYHYICSMLSQNEIVCSKCNFDLKEAFDFDVEGALARSVKAITNKEYSLSIFGLGGSIKTGKQSEDFDFVRAIEAMRSFIFDNIDESEYFIIFDELDEDYRDVLNPDRKDGYFELLISLFKAVQNVRSDFSRISANIRPVIFLRDDIFDLCRDVDKNKWLDRSVRLNWDINQLRSLTNFRLSKAVDSSNDGCDVSGAWEEVFEVNKTSVGYGRKRRQLDTFKFLTTRTFLRPRDLISYIRECAKVANSKGRDKIDNSDIKEGIVEHSAYMRREVIDELFPVLDDVSEILDVLSRIRKQIFTRKEFNDRYREFLNSKGVNRPALSETQVLKILYHFNIIGNITTANHRVFAYDSDIKVLNTDEKLCIHNGLIHSLQVL